MLHKYLEPLKNGVDMQAKPSKAKDRLKKKLEYSNDLSLHCTDFFLERRNRSYYLHCLEEVDLQMEVKMRSEVVSLKKKAEFDLICQLKKKSAKFCQSVKKS